MRHLIELLNTMAGTAARLPSSLPDVPPMAAPMYHGSAARHLLASALPPIPAAVAARHPALKAAESALLRQLADDCAGADRDYLQLSALNDQLFHQHSFAEAEAQRGLNRYSDVLPYDHNRVLLGQRADASSSSGGGGCSSSCDGSSAGGSPAAAAACYINASPLHGREGSLEWTYIAAQGPLKHTRDDFWQMVCEQQCSAVVMLTNTVERGVHKCWHYFAEGARSAKSFGRFAVSTAAVEQLLPDLVRRTLVVKDSQPPRGQPARHTVQHYHYTAWPDHGVPASPEPLLRLCGELRESGAHAAPILVHCSAGIGRSGVFCVLDVISRRLLQLQGSRDEQAGTAAVDVAALVAHLRRQRLGMVQTRDQYVFCHAALLHFIRLLAQQAGAAAEGGSGDEMPQTDAGQ